MNIPRWWNRQDDQLRPSTVDLGANKVVRTRTDMLYERKRQSIPFPTHDDAQISNMNLENYDFNSNQEADMQYRLLISAGYQAPGRDPRD
jgi:hypothetical protein